MEPTSRRKRLIENEVIFRSVNKDVQNFIEDSPKHSENDRALFYCECSKPNCLRKIKLSAKKYAELHKDKKHFMVLVGHEYPEVERVIDKTKNYQIVEKFFQPPKAKDIGNKLKSIGRSLPVSVD